MQENRIWCLYLILRRFLATAAKVKLINIHHINVSMDTFSHITVTNFIIKEGFTVIDQHKVGYNCDLKWKIEHGLKNIISNKNLKTTHAFTFNSSDPKTCCNHFSCLLAISLAALSIQKQSIPAFCPCCWKTSLQNETTTMFYCGYSEFRVICSDSSPPYTVLHIGQKVGLSEQSIFSHMLAGSSTLPCAEQLRGPLIALFTSTKEVMV